MYPSGDVQYNLSAANSMKSFQFDKVIGPESSQDMLFATFGGTELVKKVIAVSR